MVNMGTYTEREMIELEDEAEQELAMIFSKYKQDNEQGQTEGVGGVEKQGGRGKV